MCPVDQEAEPGSAFAGLSADTQLVLRIIPAPAKKRKKRKENSASTMPVRHEDSTAGSFMNREIKFTCGGSQEETAEAAKKALGEKYEKAVEGMLKILDEGGCGYIPGFMLLDVIQRFFPEAVTEGEKIITNLMSSGYLYVRGERISVVFSERVSPETLKAIFPHVFYLSIKKDADAEEDAEADAEKAFPENVTVLQLEDMADDFIEGSFSFAFRAGEDAIENATEFLSSVCGIESLGTRGISGCDYVLVSAFSDNAATMTGITENVLLQSPCVLGDVYLTDFSDGGLITSMMKGLSK